MKNKIYSFLILSLMLFVMSACSDDFFNREPEDGYGLDNFYFTVEQVTASTNHLYTKPWYGFTDRPLWAIGELSGGNLVTYDPNTIDFLQFNVSDQKGEISRAWGSLWSVVAQSNAIINKLPERTNDVDEIYINNAIGEAMFMRAIAYFYMVRIWENVPIIENNADFVNTPLVNTNITEHVYRFIEINLNYGIDNCFEKEEAEVGRITKEACQALLAKVYLYQKKYTEAKQLAEAVISSGAYDLIDGSYDDLFLVENDNNIESIAALQWSSTGTYAEGNALQARWAHSPDFVGGTGWGSVAPSVDLLNSYEENDTRRYSTIMERGNYYPNLNAEDGGYTCPDDLSTGHRTHTAVKKYVIGDPKYYGGSGQNMPNNFYLLRYADLLLVHTEAIMAGDASTSDAMALESINKVRNRAGLPNRLSVTRRQLLQERRAELALEGEFFYDVQRILPIPEALDYLGNQERGAYAELQGSLFYSKNHVPTVEDFRFNYPQEEIQKNPLLVEAPVPYYN